MCSCRARDFFNDFISGVLSHFFFEIIKVMFKIWMKGG